MATQQTPIPALDVYDSGKSLCYVRKPTAEEALRVAADVRDGYYIGIAGTQNVDMDYRSSRIPLVQAILQRPIDGFVLGHGSRLHLISQDEWDRIKAAYAAIVDAEQMTWKVEMDGWQTLPDEVVALQARYHSSETAWDRGDERAWAIMRQFDL